MKCAPSSPVTISTPIILTTREEEGIVMINQEALQRIEKAAADLWAEAVALRKTLGIESPIVQDVRHSALVLQDLLEDLTGSKYYYDADTRKMAEL